MQISCPAPQMRQVCDGFGYRMSGAVSFTEPRVRKLYTHLGCDFGRSVKELGAQTCETSSDIASQGLIKSVSRYFSFVL